MISSVTKEVAGTPTKFKFSADAQIALEDIRDMGIIKIAQDFFKRLEQEDVQTREVVQFLTLIGADGEGVEHAEARRIYSELGLLGSIEVVADCFDKAFPELAEASEQAQAQKGKSAKNPRRAASKKK